MPGDGFSVPGGSEQSRVAVLHYLGHAADVGRHHRQPGGHRLDDRQRNTLVAAGQEEHVGRGQQTGHVGTQSQQPHLLRQSVLGDEGAEGGFFRPLANHDKTQSRQPGGGPLHGAGPSDDP